MPGMILALSGHGQFPTWSLKMICWWPWSLSLTRDAYSSQVQFHLSHHSQRQSCHVTSPILWMVNNRTQESWFPGKDYNHSARLIMLLMMWTAIWNNQVVIWNLAAHYLLMEVIGPKNRGTGAHLQKTSFPSLPPQSQTKLLCAPNWIPPQVAGMLRRDAFDSEGHFGDAGGCDNQHPITNGGSHLFLVREGLPKYNINWFRDETIQLFNRKHKIQSKSRIWKAQMKTLRIQMMTLKMEAPKFYINNWDVHHWHRQPQGVGGLTRTVKPCLGCCKRDFSKCGAPTLACKLLCVCLKCSLLGFSQDYGFGMSKTGPGNLLVILHTLRFENCWVS